MSIKPTVGRSILFCPIDEDDAGAEHAAIIAFVHDDSHVNLAIFDSNGLPYNRQNVYLNQEPDDIICRGQAYWMPYQHGQAAKTESFEAKLSDIGVPNIDGAEIKNYGESESIISPVINRQLASHQIGKSLQ